MHTAQRLKKAGFSMIQASVLLAVGGIVLASTLPGSGSGDDAAKRAITLERMKKIEDATQHFMATNSRRPCPASGTLAASSANFGLEGTGPGTCTGGGGINFGPANFTSAGVGPVGYLVAGIVPVRTLGLSDEYALDGWGRRFMYIVDRNVTANTTCRNSQQAGAKGAVRILDAYGSATATDFVMWALISYGKDGHGAFPAGGSTVANRINTFTSDTDTMRNAFVDSAFTSSFTTGTAKLVKHDTTSSYDDIVWYNNTTKNTCCIGARCSQGFHVYTAGTGAVDGLNGLRYALADIDNDGYKDFVYSNYSLSGGGDAEIKVTRGMPTYWPISSGTGGGNWFIYNDYADGRTGYHIAAGGDVDGDGRDDIVITADGYTYVVWGLGDRAEGEMVAMSQLIADGQAIKLTHWGGPPGPVAIADIDGDGYKDILIAPNFPGSNVLAIVWGRKNANWQALGGSLDLLFGVTDYNDACILWASSGRQWINLPQSLATGDINNDGLDDIVAGGYTEFNPFVGGVAGATTLILGRDKDSWSCSGGGSPPTHDVDADIIAGTTGAWLLGSTAGDGVGQSVAVADMNSDGYDDMLIAARSNIYGVYGKSAAFGFPVLLDAGGASFKINITTNRPAAATLNNDLNVVAAGDLNNDSMPDVVISNAQAYVANGAFAGATYVLFAPNKTNGWANNTWVSSTPVTMFLTPVATVYDNFNGTKGFIAEGAALNYAYLPTVADFDKDKKLDLLIGAPGYNTSQGTIYVLHGRTNTPWRSRYDPTLTTLPKIDFTDIQ